VRLSATPTNPQPGSTLLLTTAILLLVWRRRQQRRSAQPRKEVVSDLISSSSALDGGGGGGGAAAAAADGGHGAVVYTHYSSQPRGSPDFEIGGLGVPLISSSTTPGTKQQGSSGSGSGSARVPVAPLSGATSGNGPASSSLQSGPLPLPPANIKLGALLGVGSFGRVFLSTWSGREVAVKVIEHPDGAEAAEVLAEAHLLLSLSHPNVVKAFDVQQGGGAAGSAASAPSPSVTGAGGLVGELLTGSRSSAVELPPLAHVAHAVAAAAAASYEATTSAAAQMAAAAAAQAAATDVTPRPLYAPHTAAAAAAAAAAALVHSSGAATTPSPPPSGTQPLLLPAPPPSYTSTTASSYRGGSTPSAALSLTARLTQHHDRGGQGRGAAGAGGAAGPMAVARTYIIQEYCSIGDLSRVASKLRMFADAASCEFQVNLLSLLEGAAAGMAYLHSRRIVHSDLNVSGLWVCVGGGQGVCVCVCVGGC